MRRLRGNCNLPGGRYFTSAPILKGNWSRYEILDDEAQQKGWVVISMKDDWKQIFSFE